MARGSPAMILVAMLAVMTIADSSPLDPSDEVAFARQARALLLRSWRTVQQLGTRYNSRRHPNDATPEARRPVSVHGSYERRHREPEDQSLHDKRTPPGKNFLGMRGKKGAPIEAPTLEQLPDFDDEPQNRYIPDVVGSQILRVLISKHKKMDSHTFLGMRGKKFSPLNGLEMRKKVAPGSQLFMGMRGKRVGDTSDEDYL